MKKFTFLMIALFIAAMGFAQGQMAYKSASAKPYVKTFASQKSNVKATASAVRATRDRVNIFEEGFEFSSDALENGWTSVDQDGDGNNWFVYGNAAVGSTVTHGGEYAIASASWAGGSALTPNNWLISPAIDLTTQSGTIKAAYFIKGQDASWYGEHYKVCVSTTTADVASFTNIAYEETIPASGWNERTIDLSSYAGQTIYLAFVHYNITDMFYIVLDDLSVYVDQSTDAAITGITAPSHGDYSTCALTNAEQIKINILNNGGAAISNFEVSYTINGGAAVTETVTASVAPAQTYEYTFNQTADLSTVGTYTIAASINLTGDEVAANNNANMTITNGDAKITIHALTDNGGGQTWTVTNTNTSAVVAERTNGWQWNIEVNDYVCVDASGCYNVVVSDQDGMVDGAAYLEILYNGTQVAGSTTADAFTGPTLTAERLGNGCSTDPEIVTEDTEFEFAAIIGEPSEAQTATIRAFNLTADITATTAAPFEVSADNTAFAATATIPAAGGTLYIRYNPTVAGEQNGTVVLSSTGAENVTITLAGTAIDCSIAHTAPFSETFAANSETLACWTIINANEDDKTFRFMYTDDAETDLVAAYPYSSTNAANDWLISPKLSIGENQRIRFNVATYGYAEKYKVFAISGSPENYASATLLQDETTVSADVEFPDMETVTIDMSSYNGQELYIGIQCTSDADMYYFFVDNFELSFNPTNAEIALTSVTPANGAAIPSGQDITLSGVVTNNGTTLTSYKVAYTVDGGEAVEYTVSEINVANAATHNFTHATPISGLTTGAHTIVVTVSEPNGVADGDDSDNSMTVNITVTAPLAYGCYFEEDPAEEGWSFVDSDNDGNNWTWENSASTPHMTTYEGIGCIYSESYNSVGALTPDNWAISPAIEIENGPISVSLYAKGQDTDYAAEHFQIYAGTSADVTAMTSVSEEFVATGEYTQYTANLPESYVGQTIYVAIRHFNVSDEFVLVVDNFEVFAYGHVVITDIEENIAESIAVYPNPTSSMVTIANAEGKDIIVVNSLGQVVASIENAAANQTIDVTNFANGTYFVKVDGEVVKLNVVK
ncbi:MAG: choice-of-anchor J domain-containing protein [Bacteroidales bacterium]|nr:choice-of-anchor J domain-containing protein [Bacteroidales bacterium]